VAAVPIWDPAQGYAGTVANSGALEAHLLLWGLRLTRGFAVNCTPPLAFGDLGCSWPKQLEGTCEAALYAGLEIALEEDVLGLVGLPWVPGVAKPIVTKHRNRCAHTVLVEPLPAPCTHW
jgi:hypothetical protein